MVRLFCAAQPSRRTRNSAGGRDCGGTAKQSTGRRLVQRYYANTTTQHGTVPSPLAIAAAVDLVSHFGCVGAVSLVRGHLAAPTTPLFAVAPCTDAHKSARAKSIAATGGRIATLFHVLDRGG